jgi:oxalate decarboxylase/phosphoglucose isomerase-like protein (cupin superfamily)
MKQIKISLYFLVAMSCLFLPGCNEPAAIPEKSSEDTSAIDPAKDASSVPAYNQAMDPLIMGGPMIKKLSDTLGVKMYEFTVKPGQSWALHTHPDHTVYMLQGGKMALYMQEAGRQDTLTFPTGMSLVSAPLTDSGKNIGKTTIKMIVTDIYRPRSK